MLEAVHTDLVSPSAWSAAPIFASYQHVGRPITPSMLRKRPTTDSWRHVAKGQDQTSRISLTFRGPIALITTLDLFYFSHVPSPGVPRGPQRPKNGQTQNPPSRLVVNSLSFLELEMIEFGRRDAAMKNSAPETNSKKYLAQSSTSLTLKLDLLISDAAFDQTITGSRAPKINI